MRLLELVVRDERLDHVVEAVRSEPGLAENLAPFEVGQRVLCSFALRCRPWSSRAFRTWGESWTFFQQTRRKASSLIFEFEQVLPAMIGRVDR